MLHEPLPSNDDTVPKPCSRIIPPAWFLTAVVTIFALDRWLPWRTILSWPWSLAGAVLIAAGIAVVLVAIRQFARRGTTVKPYEASASLVDDGIFRWTRNPMYLGMTIVLAGATLSLGSATPWLVVSAFPLWIDRCFIRAEERALAARFGDQYAAYRNRTRRWI